MRALLYAILFAAIGGNLEAQAIDFDEAEVKRHCAEEWSDDFAMQSFCFDQIAAGHRDFSALVSSEQDDVMLLAMENCRDQWDIEWNMVSFCSEQQVTARSKMPAILGDVPTDVSSTIRTKCETQWPADFAMTAFCADQAVTGWRRLKE